MHRIESVVRLLLLPVILAATAVTVAASDERRGTGTDPRWEAIHEAAMPGLATASQGVVHAGRASHGALRLPELEVVELPRPSIVVVGFTGGLERHDSPVSGVVRMRDRIRHRLGGAPEVAFLTYNNFRWRQAAADVADLTRASRGEQFTTQVPAAPLPQPLVVVYGHSWGGGSISKFARALRDERLDVSLAIYIDAFTLRNPRVPANVRYAVNFYQRTGLFRGLPLRGKSHLVAEAPESTVMLGSYRLTPDTEHFGWNWNLVQPLLYRHHHRISHDLRLQRYLLDIITLQLELLAAEPGVRS